MNNRPVLAIFGAGRAGSTLSQALHRRGYAISAVYSRTAQSAQDLAAKVNAQPVATPGATADNAQLIFLTVPDDAIRAACVALSSAQDLTGRAVVHTAGVTGMDALEPVRAQGAWVGGLHPMLPIAGQSERRAEDNQGHSIFPAGVVFGIETADPTLQGWLAEIVQVLEGVPLWLRAGQDRARYHAAGAIASNYTVTLFNEALRLLQSLADEPDGNDRANSPDIADRIDERIMRQGLVKLVEHTLINIEMKGTVAALTGPIARGDAGTVRKHLRALEQEDPELAEVYRLLGRRTLRIAAQQGLDADRRERIRHSLED